MPIYLQHFVCFRYSWWHISLIVGLWSAWSTQNLESMQRSSRNTGSCRGGRKYGRLCHICQGRLRNWIRSEDSLGQKKEGISPLRERQLSLCPILQRICSMFLCPGNDVHKNTRYYVLKVVPNFFFFCKHHLLVYFNRKGWVQSYCRILIKLCNYKGNRVGSVNSGDPWVSMQAIAHNKWNQYTGLYII